MRLLIYSDLHLEFADFVPPSTDADAVILAGDIHVGIKGMRWAIAHFPNQPVIYILGNHEYYGQAYPKHIQKMRDLAVGTNVRILENDRIQIDDIVFLGCTLWTDFALLGDPRIAGAYATERMTDYRQIRVAPEYRKLRSLDTASIHRKSLSWLTEALMQSQGKPIVVVTHHAPSNRSLQEFEKDELLSVAYASNLDELVSQSGARLWVHGHLHNQRNYWIGATRVVSNPRGYPSAPNFAFDPGLV
ncbi:metallophosphoesterase, partial [filamentous cyanobacterium LEGE 11480]